MLDSKSVIASLLLTQVTPLRHGLSLPGGEPTATATQPTVDAVGIVTREALSPAGRGVFGEPLTLEPHVEAHLSFPHGCLPQLIRRDGGVNCVPPHMIVGADGGAAWAQSRAAVRYLPGQGLAIRFAGYFGECTPGDKSAVGLLTPQDGLGFGCCPTCAADGGAEFSVLRRANGVDNWAPKSTWNGDKFAFDITKGNVYQAAFQWLGYGALQFAIENPANGVLEQVHQINYANQHTDTSFRNPSLPIRAEVSAGAQIALSSIGVMRQGTNSTVGLRYTVSAARAATTSGVAVVSLRNTPTFLGSENRTTLVLESIGAANGGSTNNNIQLFLVLIAGGVDGGSYTDIDPAASIASYNTTSTGYGAPAARVGWSATLEGGGTLYIPLPDARLYPGEELAVIAVSTNGTPVATVSLNWREEY